MVTDLRILIALCDEELFSREYESKHHQRIKEAWAELVAWADSHQYKEFSTDIGYQYCDEKFGMHILARGAAISLADQIKLRAVRMLTSYQQYGVFEFRTPAVEKTLEGHTGTIMSDYLLYLREERNLADSTIGNKERYLRTFNDFLTNRNLTLDNLSVAVLQEFFTIMGYSLANRHNCGSCLKLFFLYLYDKNLTKKDNSIYVLPDNYNRHSKIPSTYESEEIQRMIASIERSSAMGKRDYLILLLAAEYGWRSGDITRFSFEQVDWEKNTISFNQHKTGVPVVYPLLSSIGNALIDYLKHGRPDTNAREIIVSHMSSNKGQPLLSPTIHSVVSKYMRKAGIKNWQDKKHGAHALRHSLATNMLRQNTSLPIISTVLGHQNTESTNVYLKIDIDKLRQCVLPMPELHSAWYEEN